jgi:formiminotetrahydrofolate cyclodeaminase
VKRAEALRARAQKLGLDDLAAYEELLATGSVNAREQTIDVPLALAELAAETAELCAASAERASGAVAFDAAAGVILAESAARVAEMLVAANLSGADDPRGGQATDAAARAARAATRRL